MVSGGHNKKPTAILKMEGTFDPKVHGDRVDELVVGDKPNRPASLQGRAREAWDRIVKATPAGVYGVQDTDLLVMYCRTYEKYDAAYKADNLAAQTRYAEVIIRLAGKLGLGPIERARMTCKPKPKKDSFENFSKKAR